MAKNDDTEEKSLPPSQIKLNKLRRDGQVARSKDLPAAVSVLAITCYLVWMSQSILQSFAHFFEAPLSVLPQTGREFDIGYFGALVRSSAVELLLMVAVPAALGVVAVIVTAIIDGQGLLMSMKHMKLDFNRMNPAEGFKKMFSFSSIIEFVKSMVKFAVLTTAGAATLIYFLNAVFWSPLCGAECSLAVSSYLIATMVVIVSIIIVIAAAFDIRISRGLFQREHRMTKTESKREQKETYGDPHVRSARRRIGNEIRRG
ncbi:EscU/YscU/HrcU family type III secretion system export apparatus switch protein [Agrobacterium larrymoorei]|uniref:EscU/YscU/HrcU family type III secretion system export apparatus switch protein n=1 Tax=Agrobacterium larrymoorei TaxID=160699 RepID=UPI0015721F38|nr:EscU/YscU/HrcU family type III secretion system export apparatus switch protein [Agrobacterium larrymoorei]NTJ41868.1 EscU/YscU/HrcU family type III secretion system export apparatus switch protein [Agrobacterium larrymoorei]